MSSQVKQKSQTKLSIQDWKIFLLFVINRYDGIQFGEDLSEALELPLSSSYTEEKWAKFRYNPINFITLELNEQAAENLTTIILSRIERLKYKG